MDSSSIGDLLRDHQGHVWFSFSLKLAHFPSPKHAKTISIWEGLRLEEIFGYTRFAIESDCKGVIY